MKKKFLAIGLASIMLLSCLTGCQKEKPKGSLVNKAGSDETTKTEITEPSETEVTTEHTKDPVDDPVVTPIVNNGSREYYESLGYQIPDEFIEDYETGLYYVENQLLLRVKNDNESWDWFIEVINMTDGKILGYSEKYDLFQVDPGYTNGLYELLDAGAKMYGGDAITYVSINYIPDEVTFDTAYTEDNLEFNGQLFIPEQEPLYIQYEESIDSYYLRDSLVLYCEDGISFEEIEKLASNYGAIVTGAVEMDCSYLIDFATQYPMPYEDLVSFAEDILNENDFVYDVDLYYYREIEEEPVSYYREVTEDDIVTDEETGITYAKNQLLISFELGTEKSEAEELISGLDAEIIGEIEITCDYQILFNSDKTYDELIAIAEELEKNPIISMAYVNTVFEITFDT